jgi:hypothetical protein
MHKSSREQDVSKIMLVFKYAMVAALKGTFIHGC